MPSIRPVSDLRNHFAEITKEVQETKEPVFLTKNGVGSIVSHEEVMRSARERLKQAEGDRRA